MSPGKKKAVILIVDDEKNSREGLARALQRHHEVRLAENGMKALELLAAEPIDVLLSDVRMPGMDGLTLLQRAGREWQPARGFSDAEINATRRQGGQNVKILGNFIRAIVLEHDAARPHSNARCLSQDPGNQQLRRGAGKVGSVVVFGNPEAVIAQIFCLLRQRQRTRQRIGSRFVFSDGAFIQNADSP